ncbi:Angiopoietin-related protein 3 [Merluccius polli]|uniref:Angiopoietin-related protein 3 n=1 Tax=Merluccius polli TaxID=89951 RepID=A0AA47MXS4_MERPO|nr:Angiopoietin-related protein 3 [Merluccius polli]
MELSQTLHLSDVGLACQARRVDDFTIQSGLSFLSLIPPSSTILSHAPPQDNVRDHGGLNWIHYSTPQLTVSHRSQGWVKPPGCERFQPIGGTLSDSQTSQQLCVLLLCLGTAHHAPVLPPGVRGSQVPDSHLKMLSLGLVRLLREVEDSTQRLERQGEQVAVEVEEACQALENLHKQSFQAGRTHKQARKALQVMSARGDQRERAVQDLQQGLELLVEDEGLLEDRMAQILQKLRVMTDPQGESPPQPNASQMKVKVDKQARRLASLASEVIARDKMINRHLRSIEYLEKQLYDMREGSPGPGPGPEPQLHQHHK